MRLQNSHAHGHHMFTSIHTYIHTYIHTHTKLSVQVHTNVRLFLVLHGKRAKEFIGATRLRQIQCNRRNLLVPIPYVASFAGNFYIYLYVYIPICFCVRVYRPTCCARACITLCYIRCLCVRYLDIQRPGCARVYMCMRMYTACTSVLLCSTASATSAVTRVHVY